MGRLFKRYIPEKEEIYSCKTCNTHLSSKNQIISKSFHGRGRWKGLFSRRSY